MCPQRRGATVSIKYRPDIDGLRALAVIPVVLYHADAALFSGGFVGVDVFFVISGYLITSLIVSAQDAGAFSIANFYERRIRRIFPALFVVMVGTAVFGWFVLAPQDYKRLGESIAATSAFSSNILFWRQSGYFRTPPADTPLLHTWSLAVEEQFYVLLPLALIAIARWCPAWRIRIIAVIALISFLTSAVSVYISPGATFFLAPTRAWELLLGSLLAMGVLSATASQRRRSILGVCGLLLILVPMVTYSKRTMFPGAAALPPALGAAMLIYSGTGGSTVVNRVLATSPAVFVGKISYPLYLWHFPLLAFGSYLSIDATSWTERSILVGAAVALSILSWKFVETPVRRAGTFAQRAQVFTFAASLMAAFIALGGILGVADGIPGRLTAAQLALLKDSDDHDPDRTTCFTDSAAAVLKKKLCSFGETTGAPSFVVWGDSHAEALRPAFRKLARQHGVRGVFVGFSGCPPLIRIQRVTDKRCGQINAAILQWILQQRSLQTIVLASRWGLYANGTGYKAESIGDMRLADGDRGHIAKHADGTALLELGLHETLAALLASNRRVWVVGPIPEVGYDVPKSRYRHVVGIDAGFSFEPTTTEFLQRQAGVFQALGRVAGEYPAVGYVWPHRALCDEHRCRVEQGDHALYHDDDHLSVFGAELIAGIFDPLFRDGPRPPEKSDHRIAVVK
jgi:peptidoglycan/LPS O-acetylase OafA/YrhL